MRHTNGAPLPKREIKVQVRDRYHGEWEAWHDLWHIDPLHIQTDDRELADVFDADLLSLVEGMFDWDDCKGQRDFRLVWSDTGHRVLGVCPVCDDTFTITEGIPGDELNEGFNAMTCGCNTP